MTRGAPRSFLRRGVIFQKATICRLIFFVSLTIIENAHSQTRLRGNSYILLQHSFIQKTL